MGNNENNVVNTIETELFSVFLSNLALKMFVMRRQTLLIFKVKVKIMCLILPLT